MGTLYGITDTEVIPQSDFYAVQTENGGWTATQTFWFKKGGVDSPSIAAKFQIGNALAALDPDTDDLFTFLRLTRISSVQTIEGGYTAVGCEFTGFSTNTYQSSPTTPDPAPTYSKRGVLIEAPLDEHPKWKALTDDEKFALGLLIRGEAVSKPDFTGVGTYDDDGVWQAWQNLSGEITLTGDAVEFAKRIAQGRTTYKLGTYQYTHRWEASTGISATVMNDLGKISTPSGSPPAPGTGRDWLLEGVNEEQHGSGNFSFTNELVYLLSDEDGHDSFLQS